MEPFIPAKLPLSDVRWEPLIPLIGHANRALAHFEGVLHGVPNAELLLSPLATKEAVLSSKIEGTQATLGEVLLFDASQESPGIEKQHDIHEIINYRTALREAEGWLTKRPFSLNLLKHLHNLLLNSVRGRDKARGEFRRIQNWIGTPGSPVERASFVPPPPHLLPEYLDNWERYYHDTSPDALVQLAIVHAQFEILHPFLDGNGRLGRILIPLFLYERKLLSRPVFYLSEWLDEHREEYVGALRDLGRRDDAWNRWITFFLTGIQEQAHRNSRVARSVMDLYERSKRRIIDLTRSQHAVPLLDQLFRRPIFQSTDLTFQSANKVTVANLLRALRDANMITVLRESAGRRAAVYSFAELINLCEARSDV